MCAAWTEWLSNRSIRDIVDLLELHQIHEGQIDVARCLIGHFRWLEQPTKQLFAPMVDCCARYRICMVPVTPQKREMDLLCSHGRMKSKPRLTSPASASRQGAFLRMITSLLLDRRYLMADGPAITRMSSKRYMRCITSPQTPMDLSPKIACTTLQP